MDRIVATFSFGASLHVVDPMRVGFDKTADWLDEQGITIYSVYTAGHRELTAEMQPDPRLARGRTISITGEPLSGDEVVSLPEHFNSDCVIVNAYGCTECPTICSYTHRVGDEVSWSQLPAGYPPPGVCIR